MASYSVEFKKSAAKELALLPAKECQRVIARSRDLATDPRPAGSEKLSGDDKYRIRQGRYRVVYRIDDSDRLVTIFRVAHRKEAYR